MHLRFPIQWGGENCNRAKKNKFSLDKKKKKHNGSFSFQFIEKSLQTIYVFEFSDNRDNFLTMKLFK